jgi:hypothetical protein
MQKHSAVRQATVVIPVSRQCIIKQLIQACSSRSLLYVLIYPLSLRAKMVEPPAFCYAIIPTKEVSFQKPPVKTNF